MLKQLQLRKTMGRMTGDKSQRIRWDFTLASRCNCEYNSCRGTCLTEHSLMIIYIYWRSLCCMQLTYKVTRRRACTSAYSKSKTVDEMFVKAKNRRLSHNPAEKGVLPVRRFQGPPSKQSQLRSSSTKAVTSKKRRFHRRKVFWKLSAPLYPPLVHLM